MRSRLGLTAQTLIPRAFSIQLPLDYYGGGILVAMKASNELKDAFIEFVNPAVACVYPG